MNMHKNARLTPKGRELLIARLQRGERPGDVACAMGVSIRTGYKWRAWYLAEGLAGLQDRSSRPAPISGPGSRRICRPGYSASAGMTVSISAIV